MQIRFVRTVTDAEVAAIAAEAQLPYTRTANLTYQKGDVWHVADDLGLALCTADQDGAVAEECTPDSPAPVVADATVATDTDEE